MKIAVPDMELTLFESNAKKCAFLTEISQRLGAFGSYGQRGADTRNFRLMVGGLISYVPVHLGNYQVFLPWASERAEAGRACGSMARYR